MTRRHLFMSWLVTLVGVALQGCSKTSESQAVKNQVVDGADGADVTDGSDVKLGLHVEDPQPVQTECKTVTRRFKCSNGHMWDEDEVVECENLNGQVFISSIKPSNFVKINNNPTNFCYLCMAEFWEKTLGIVEEV